MKYVQSFEIWMVGVGKRDSKPSWKNIQLEAQFEKREQAIEHFSEVLGTLRKTTDIKNAKLTENGVEIKTS